MLSFETEAARTLRETLPGEGGLPVVGHSLTFLTEPLEFAMRFYDRYGPIGWVSSFGLTSVFALGPEANQAVFRDKDQSYSNAEAWDFFIGPFFRRGLMLLDFEEHRFHRNVMQAAFKRPVMERYFVHMQPSIRRALERWPYSRTIRVSPRVKQLTLDVATEVFMGEQLGPEADAVNRAFIDTVRAGTSLVRYPVPFGRWKKGLDGRALLERFIRSRIPGKRARPTDDLFARLCEATDESGNRFSDEDVVNHMIFLMMAAHDTSTITLTSMFYRLAKHPEWQERVREEMLAAAPTADDLGLDAFQRMPTLDLVMKESMRLLTPLHVMARKTVKEVDLLGHRIPAGVHLTISPGATHRLRGHWTDPERFDPDRFGEARAEHRRHPFQFVPFGGGAHKCIGMHFGEMEIKSVAYHALARFRFEVDPAYEMPIDYTSLPVPSDGLPLLLERI